MQHCNIYKSKLKKTKKKTNAPNAYTHLYFSCSHLWHPHLHAHKLTQQFACMSKVPIPTPLLQPHTPHLHISMNKKWNPTIHRQSPVSFHTFVSTFNVHQADITNTKLGGSEGGCISAWIFSPHDLLVSITMQAALGSPNSH